MSNNRTCGPSCSLVRGLSLALTLCACLVFSCAQSPVTATRRALLIGISHYSLLSDKDLTFPVPDAQSMAELLNQQSWKSSLEISTVSTPGATKAAIKACIQSLLAASEPGDTVLIYYSGHGYQDLRTGISYIVPSDARANLSPEFLVSPAELSSWLASARTDNIVLILDSCNSGGFVHTGESIDYMPGDYTKPHTGGAFPWASFARWGELLAKNAQASGACVPVTIAAAGAPEFSYETSRLGHGVFTYYFLESAVHGDSNGDGWISCTEACAYTASRIDALWNNGYSADFMPHISGGMRDIVLFAAP